jgi:hypothetical protein
MRPSAIGPRRATFAAPKLKMIERGGIEPRWGSAP